MKVFFLKWNLIYEVYQLNHIILHGIIIIVNDVSQLDISANNISSKFSN